MQVAFYLESPKGVKRNLEGLNPTSIFARISYAGYRLKYFVPESNILPKYWNGKTKPHRARQALKGYANFNKRLDDIEADIKAVINNYAINNRHTYPKPQVLKPLLDTAIKSGGNVEKVTFMSFFASFIERSKAGTRLGSKGKPITPGTIKTYSTTKTIVENYQDHSKKKVDFDNIDMSFYNDFTAYVTKEKKQSTNYIGKHIKVIKTVLHDATELKVNTNLSFQGRGFTTISEETDEIYLPEHELKEFENLDLNSSPSLDRVRDLFLVGCNTGLRFSDLSALRPEHIKDGMITITQKKTGDTVVIPVHATVTKIMNKYGGNLPKALPDQKTNEALKKIAEKCDSMKKFYSKSQTKGGELVTGNLPKYKLVKTHTARRSFCTNCYLNGIPTISIMAISGHKTEKAFMKYIKVSPDGHAKIMQGIWNEQSKRIAI